MILSWRMFNMRIGIDLSVLQTDHKYRGIGAVVINFINNLEIHDKTKNTFIFFIETKNEKDAFDLLDLTDITYETHYLLNKKYLQLPGTLNVIPKIFYKALGYLQYLTGDPRISRTKLKDIDCFIQFDQNRKLPRRASRNSVLFLHDLIPYILESDYLWSFKTARLNGRSFKGSVKFAFLRFQYISRVKISTRRAKTLITNSQHTKNDFVKYLGVNPKKVHVALLGVNFTNSTVESTPSFEAYTSTMWGDVKRPLDPTKKPYLLFIGGTDHRRKMVDLLAAFNNLKARGNDISLLISGDSVEGINDIKNPKMKKYMEQNSSYKDDIHLLGYINNDQRDWLYSHALAFVFPSIYEGFGLPVLEAMSQNAPVITYENTAIAEVAGNSALYANGYLQIVDQVEKLIANPTFAADVAQHGNEHSRNFTWIKTKDSILKALNS